ncbi:MAG: hypothetical protein M1832_002459 [Thelocarpon impressellum]|nr:MAG: hypothetical protein M1832_002459 [Thelocarpon impressellum]
MASRVTRRSSAREAAFLASSEEDKPPQQLSSPPATPSPKPTRKGQGKGVPKKSSKQNPKEKAASKGAPPITLASTRKRKRVASAKVEEDINELPHNLGRLPGGSTPAAKAHAKDSPAGDQAASENVRIKDEVDPSPAKRTSARRAKNIDAQQALHDPANLVAAEKLAAAAAESGPEEPPKKKGRKAKVNPYGLTPGETPYPDWPHPTAAECQEVTDLLSKVHGEVKAPASIPAPSTTVSGCGEVPSILDALIRTLLSAATTGTNSSRAFQGLVDKFGLRKEGIGKGSVNWDKVRLADRKDVFEAIKSGGLAATKSQRIQEILDLVYQENMARRDALVEANDAEGAKEPRGAENESKEQKEAEISRADQRVLSLDHLHALSSDEALNTLIKYPGIGPKTASCVLLFCMQRPSFAVDTHVFRLCKWLNWVPPDKANRNTTYSHCEVRVPDNLKYPLHQLMIRHGKTCPRCRAATGENSADWDKGCPIDHLIARTGKRKGGAGASSKKRAKKGKRGSESEESEESDEEADDYEDEEEQGGDAESAEDDED